MLDRMAVGELPKKPHTALRDPQGALRYEQCLTRAGFDGPFSILYHVGRPHALTAQAPAHTAIPTLVPADPRAHDEAPTLRRRHFRTAALRVAGSLLDARTPLLGHRELALSICTATDSEGLYFANADADELLFVREGRGVVRSVFGDLAFGPKDYVCIPKGVLRRVIVAEPLHALAIECSGLRIPTQYRNEAGQLRMDAPYSHRDFRRPEFTGPVDEGLRDVAIKRAGRHHLFRAHSSPLDVVGWDGTVYPWAFPILAFQPRVSSVHLPPTWHGTFAAASVLICSFVPRPLDFDAAAIPCPYPHASVDVDEVLYYVAGSFGSRTGVEPGSVTLHPRGVPHGPHPGRYEASVGTTHTDELAVMLDSYEPLLPSSRAREYEDLDYDESFLGGSGG